MKNDIPLFDAIYTQRALRRFNNDPISDSVVEKLIEAATKAPSGSNKQQWGFVVVRDHGTRERIGAYYLRAWTEVFGHGSNTLSPRIKASAEHLGHHMADAPVLVFACIPHLGTSNLTLGASIYPAVQNFLLAARAMGIGSVLTTLHKRYEVEIKELLNIPDNVETVALLPLGYPADGEGYGPTRRRPVSEVIHWEKWTSETYS
ncbi:MAG: nitroreductase family protein [SAR202 cluster bacterium]|jgi:nitroreductase|nr:nitroreductase family protein [SAR202 cluster bacterium]